MAKTFSPTVGETPQAIERSRAMAQALAQQAMTPEQMQMVSGHVVPYSPIQGLTKLAQALMARKMQEGADAKEEAYKQAQQAKVMGWVQRMPQGTPEMETEGPARPGEAMATTAAVAPSKQEQMAWALNGMASPGTAGIAAPFLAQMMKEKDLIKAGPGDVVFDPNTNKPLFTAPPKPEEWKAPTTFLAGQEGNPDLHVPSILVKDPTAPGGVKSVPVAPPKKGSPVASVEVKNIQEGEKEQFKAMQKDMGEYRIQIQKAGVEAPRQLARLDRMEKLLEGVEGGKYANNVAQLASMANTLGIKIDPRLGDKEAAESLAIEMASNFRQPGTGPMTDKDFENFMKRVPDLSKTAAGRKEITKTMREFIKDDIETAKLAREYAKKNRGLLDEDFFAQVGESRAKRGFGNFDQTLSEDEQKELSALRARFGK